MIVTSLETNLLSRYQGCLLGLACGDAVGTSVEFRSRGSFKPVTDMYGGGPFGLKAGQWTDDTSMALCLAESLLTKQGFDPADQMTRYANWWEWGYWSSTGTCFDIGLTTKAALINFLLTREPYSGSTEPETAGNGSIMRLAPIAMYLYPNQDNVRQYATLSSKTTHGAKEAIEACELLAIALMRCFQGKNKNQVLQLTGLNIESPKLRAIAQSVYLNKPHNEIVGSGYVVESLEAALWAFATTNSFEEAVLAATNLGDDADTTAAITGQIAGAFYGVNWIPSRWLQRLYLQQEICAFADALYAASKR